MDREISIIGIDCATESAKTGLALARYARGRVSVRMALACKGKRPEDIVGEWVDEVEWPVLLAVDAPLGWPEPLTSTLIGHRAGDPLSANPNRMFRRTTDVHIKARLGKTPLDVGADRIARTAHAALGLLDYVRSECKTEVSLAWNPIFQGVKAIEVYPAATLIAHNLASSGYKGVDQLDQRRSIIEGLSQTMKLDIESQVLEESPDALDAVVCVLSAYDFLEGKAVGPCGNEAGTIIKEGWIWAAARGVASEVRS